MVFVVLASPFGTPHMQTQIEQSHFSWKATNTFLQILVHFGGPGMYTVDSIMNFSHNVSLEPDII